MIEKSVDVLGIGNALVDVLCRIDDEFLTRHELDKGAMLLIDADRAEALYADMSTAIEASGGSAANTMAAIAALGGRAAFIGKVADDQFGDIFAHDIAAVGVAFHRVHAEGVATGCSMVLITPDAQRTMNTYLGAAKHLAPDDIEPEAIATARVVYMEGYLWDEPSACEAFRKAMGLTKEAGGKVSLTLSDTFCVERHRADFVELVENRVDILFANEDEIKSLYQEEDFERALERVRGVCEIAALTLSGQGSVIVTADETIHVAAEPLARLVDSTGAGDLYAAGFLHGLTQGEELATCGRLGSIAAAEVLQHMGARPQSDLKAVVAEAMG